MLQYFKIDVVDPQKELVDPAQLGTRNVLQEVKRTHSVERVVLTSSCAAIYGDNADLKKHRMEFSQKIWLVAPMVNKAMTRKWISRNVNLPWIGDNSKGVRELEMRYRPMKESMIEFFQQMIDSDQLQPPK